MRKNAKARLRTGTDREERDAKMKGRDDTRYTVLDYKLHP